MFGTNLNISSEKEIWLLKQSKVTIKIKNIGKRGTMYKLLLSLKISIPSAKKGNNEKSRAILGT